jgi:hypothetical protein
MNLEIIFNINYLNKVAYTINIAMDIKRYWGRAAIFLFLK